MKKKKVSWAKKYIYNQTDFLLIILAFFIGKDIGRLQLKTITETIVMFVIVMVLGILLNIWKWSEE
jgi:hypothetical protein